ncbi:histone-lysine N-methyltransferase SETMAR [Trichonephila clavipes]|nr:histone-lysine N-methyltransferase SETMAR [Trichonephila clavipes]
MAAPIQNLVKYEVHSVIRFLHAKGRTDVYDEQRTGRPSMTSDALLQRTEEAIHANRRLKLKELHQIIPEVSMITLYEVVTVKLGYRKLCARWVPKLLTEGHKKKRMGFALDFLTRYAEAGDEFLDHIVTGEETWVYHHTPESKQQSMQWRHSNSPKAKKCKTSISAKKIMASVFWDIQGILLLEFMPPGMTINAAAYCQTLKRLRKTIQNKRRRMLTNGVHLLHDNAWPHTALVTKALLKQMGSIGQSAIQPGTCAQRLPFIPLPEVTSWRKIIPRR